MIARKVSKLIFDKRALKNVISATILTGAVIGLSLAVFGWSQVESSDYNSRFGESVDGETARLEEKLVFQYVSCGNSLYDISVYLFSCGTIEDVEIKSVYIINGTWLKVFSTPTLYSLDATRIPDQDLDVGEEGYFVLSLSSSLSSGFYNIKAVTVRGAIFESRFMA